MCTEGGTTASFFRRSDCCDDTLLLTDLPAVSSLTSLLPFVCSFVVCGLPPTWRARLLTHLFASRSTGKLSFSSSQPSVYRNSPSISHI
jgi:hypothetical protein